MPKLTVTVLPEDTMDRVLATADFLSAIYGSDNVAFTFEAPLHYPANAPADGTGFASNNVLTSRSI